MNSILYRLKNPLNLLKTVLALLRGLFYILYYRIFASSVRISFPFLAYAKVSISGPGCVKIGRRCAVYKNVFKGLAIVTLSKSAAVEIGERCSLGGVTIRSRSKVTIGDGVMTAISLIQDTFYICDESITAGISVPGPKPVTIGTNAWLSANCIILGGTSIGEDGVIAAGSLCLDASVRNYSLVSGSPIKRALPIDKLLRLRNTR